jgi:hypothetical protein
VAAARVEIDKLHDGWAEEKRVDLVKIATVPLKDLAERLAEVARRRRGDLRAQLEKALVIAADP